MSYGKYTYGNPLIKYWQTNLETGKFCSISDGTLVYLGGNHRIDWVTTYPFGHIYNNIFPHNGHGHPVSKGKVMLGNDIHISENVTIMSGVTIGDGAIITNGSHVVKDVPPYSIVGGNPAQVIEYRFNKEQIEELLKIKWWDWDESKINENLPLLLNDNIDLFIEKHRVVE